MIIAINLFILCWLAVIVFGTWVPESSDGGTPHPIGLIIDGLGLRQYWAMFAPDPTARSVRLHVLIHLSSGAAIRWDPPRFRASRPAAFRGFRRRLFELMLADPDGRVARHSLATFLVRTYCSLDAPVAVTFVGTAVSVPTPWDDMPGESGEWVIETIPVEATDDFAARAR